MKKYLWIVALLAALAMVTTGCPDGSGDGKKDSDITYTAVPASGDTTTAITLSFSADVSITATDITLTNGTGEATKGDLTGSTKSWSLAITTTKAGNVTVKITKTGIEAAAKTVAVKLASGPVVPGDPGNLGLPTYNLGTGDVEGSESQAAWTISKTAEEELFDSLTIPGTTLEVTFENELAGTLQLIWQGSGWNSNDILTTSGGEKPELGTSVSDDKKTVTIDLSLALKDYGTPTTGFVAQMSTASSVKLILAYYSGANKIKGLNVVKADLIPGEISNDFVAVTDIEYAGSTKALNGVPLTLTATVAPLTATNKTIVWSATGGTISGNTFTPSAVGNATVTATITNGATATTNFTKTFNITVSAPAASVANYSPNFTTSAPEFGYASWASSHTRPTITLISTDGYTYDFTPVSGSEADYDNVYAFFKVTFATGVCLADYDSVTFTYTGISGDIGSKQIGLFAKADKFANESINDSYLVTNKSAITGTTATSVTLTIDKSRALLMTGIANEFYVSIFSNMAKAGGGTATKYSIESISFSKN